MCGPGRGRPAPATSGDRRVDGADGSEPQGAPGNTLFPKMDAGVGAAWPGWGASEGPWPLPAHPCFPCFLGRATHSAGPGHSGGRRPTALPREAGTKGGLQRGAESCSGAVWPQARAAPLWASQESTLALERGQYKVNVRCKHLRPWALRVTEGQTERQRWAGAWPKSHHQ